MEQFPTCTSTQTQGKKVQNDSVKLRSVRRLVCVPVSLASLMPALRGRGGSGRGEGLMGTLRRLQARKVHETQGCWAVFGGCARSWQHLKCGYQTSAGFPCNQHTCTSGRSGGRCTDKPHMTAHSRSTGARLHKE